MKNEERKSQVLCRANRKLLLLGAVLLHAGIRVCAQGCNDAGLCTMGDIKQNAASDSGYFQLSGSVIFRLGEKNSSNITLLASAAVNPWKTGRLSLQLPLQVVSGNLGTISGPGDIAFDLTQVLWNKDSTKISVTIGGKVPSTDANRKKNGEPLPMAYQTSQGTWDVIAGVNMFFYKWHFSIAYQHNFNANENMYLSSLKGYARELTYFDSRKIDRGDDMLLRIEREFWTREKSKFIFGILPIYRIQEATIENIEGKRMPVSGSAGLTINLNAGYVFSQGTRRSIRLFIGAPAITRHIRPDGLTGTFVAGFSVNWLL